MKLVYVGSIKQYDHVTAEYLKRLRDEFNLQTLIVSHSKGTNDVLVAGNNATITSFQLAFNSVKNLGII